MNSEMYVVVSKSSIINRWTGMTGKMVEVKQACCMGSEYDDIKLDFSGATVWFSRHELKKVEGQNG